MVETYFRVARTESVLQYRTNRVGLVIECAARPPVPVPFDLPFNACVLLHSWCTGKRRRRRKRQEKKGLREKEPEDHAVARTRAEAYLMERRAQRAYVVDMRKERQQKAFEREAPESIDEMRQTMGKQLERQAFTNKVLLNMRDRVLKLESGPSLDPSFSRSRRMSADSGASQ